MADSIAPKKIKVARRLRRDETSLEHRLWQALRSRNVFGLKFRRQHPIGPYVADFACPKAKLVIEIDGPWHAKRLKEDAERTNELRRYGYEVVRFPIEDGGSDVGPLVEAIAFAVKERLRAHPSPRAPLPSKKGEG